MDFYQDFRVPVLNGECDEFLDEMIKAIKLRREAMAPQIWEFEVGQPIRLSSTTRPKYLAGAQGIVKKVNRTKVVIDLDKPHGKFYTNISTPLSMIEKV
jgi:hypothetical protein